MEGKKGVEGEFLSGIANSFAWQNRRLWDDGAYIVPSSHNRLFPEIGRIGELLLPNSPNFGILILKPGIYHIIRPAGGKVSFSVSGKGEKCALAHLFYR
jgi:hypothetical protein